MLRLAEGCTRRSWECICACGTTKVVAQKELRASDTKSCGCVRSKQLAKRNKVGKINHDTLSIQERRAYNSWKYMHNRCNNPTGKSECYALVFVCPEWRDFRRFLLDMGTPPEGYSLDRINSELGYSPHNCRWIPLSHQAKNTSRNRYVMFKGKRKILSDHARDNGLEPDIVFDRINKLGWSVDRALSTQKLTNNDNVAELKSLIEAHADATLTLN